MARTGKPVVAAFVVIAGVEDGKTSYEHIYWDQPSVLVQICVLDPKGLPAPARAVWMAERFARLVRQSVSCDGPPAVARPKCA